MSRSKISIEKAEQGIKHCHTCDRDKPYSAFHTDHSKWDGKEHRCKECAAKHRDEFLAQLKDQVFTAYGNKCACCGEPNRVFLILDHVYGGGSKLRRENGSTKRCSQYCGQGVGHHANRGADVWFYKPRL